MQDQEGDDVRDWGIAQAGGVGTQVFGDAGEDAVDASLLFGGLRGGGVGGLEALGRMKCFAGPKRPEG